MRFHSPQRVLLGLALSLVFPAFASADDVVVVGTTPTEGSVTTTTEPTMTTTSGPGSQDVPTQKLAGEFQGFLGDDAETAVRALRTGDSFTIGESSDPMTGDPGMGGTDPGMGGTDPGTTPTDGSVTIDPPTGNMGNGNVRLSLELAEYQLKQAGIEDPTAADVQASLTGGSVTNADGVTTELSGVLNQRADGMGWGQIAKESGTKVGWIKNGKAEAALAAQRAGTSDPADGTTGGEGGTEGMPGTDGEATDVGATDGPAADGTATEGGESMPQEAAALAPKSRPGRAGRIVSGDGTPLDAKVRGPKGETGAKDAKAARSTARRGMVDGAGATQASRGKGIVDGAGTTRTGRGKGIVDGSGASRSGRGKGIVNASGAGSSSRGRGIVSGSGATSSGRGKGVVSGSGASMGGNGRGRGIVDASGSTASSGGRGHAVVNAGGASNGGGRGHGIVNAAGATHGGGGGRGAAITNAGGSSGGSRGGSHGGGGGGGGKGRGHGHGRGK